MTEKGQAAKSGISEVSLTRSSSRFVGVLRLPRLRNTRFHGEGLRDNRTWREGVLSLKHRRCNETNQYHPAKQSPYENDWLPGNGTPLGLGLCRVRNCRDWFAEPRVPKMLAVNRFVEVLTAISVGP